MISIKIQFKKNTVIVYTDFDCELMSLWIMIERSLWLWSVFITIVKSKITKLKVD